MAQLLKDPICGALVAPGRGFPAAKNGAVYYVCSPQCRAALVAGGPVQGAPPTFEESPERRKIAYFSMEVAVDPEMPTYSGGLGVLAGDTLKSCADLAVPMIAVSLLHRMGYFTQHISPDGRQSEQPTNWAVENFLIRNSPVVHVELEERRVAVRSWKYYVIGARGHVVPLFFLDTDLEENTPEDRALTSFLYGGDERYRLAQEILLGIGGVRMLEALGFKDIERYHMNEGHSALLGLELLERNVNDGRSFEAAAEAVRRLCVFTTHTPVPAGHDKFDYQLVRSLLKTSIPEDRVTALAGEENLNMTLLALNLSGYVNGVARKHKEVSRGMFPGYEIQHITNGIHSYTWTADAVRSLFDLNIPGWSGDPAMLRHAVGIPDVEMLGAHRKAKECLYVQVERRHGKKLPMEVFAVGFARRATPYKRADLLLSDMGRLATIAAKNPISIIFAGKAHPRDEGGKELIQRIVEAAASSIKGLSIVFLENYDMELARLLVGGVDVWLNTPQRPLEASGTSGMKAAHNGVPSMSILDGWWIEGCISGITGWPIGPMHQPSEVVEDVDTKDAEDLYDKLEGILEIYYKYPREWASVMKQAIAFNASFFNTHRMVQQYVTNAYIT